MTAGGEIFSQAFLEIIRQVVREEIGAQSGHVENGRMKKEGKRESDLLTPQDAAEILSMSRASVRRLLVEGRIPAVILRSGPRNKIWRVRPEVLKKWIQSRESTGDKSGR